ncbi:SAM-dependent methyltransferase [Fulvivirga imtechensis AK7]|uniref:SAM-dependent methyltransferase n=1 Tax=Fulvivirga imtechensis AK7 TaxID=1237149 RepID=L8JR37_9BACT|nr:class I SAM-dependent methyltransferase [Fulvivirga imtechensis]ELR70668.1 SAM-dependent methyltransferase [Fulvivirga imtechensis AK7]
MLEKVDNCPLCNGGHFNDYIVCEDFTVSHEKFTITQCDQCHLLLTNPRPTAETISSYYQSENYISHQNKSTNPINLIYKIARHFTIKSKIRLLKRLTTTGKVLDVGCGTGHFLKACQKEGWQAMGVEPDPTARAIASDKTGIQITNTLFKLETTFDIITLWHVLEHVSDLTSYLTKLYDLLDNNGTIIVAVPNYRSFDAQHYKEYWAGYDVPRHLYHFDQDAMLRLMAKHQLKVREIVPMKLDAYYVSMLSEGYKRPGLKKYVNSFITGWKSNIYAKKNNKNYSSLIYIITK